MEIEQENFKITKKKEKYELLLGNQCKTHFREDVRFLEKGPKNPEISGYFYNENENEFQEKIKLLEDYTSDLNTEGKVATEKIRNELELKLGKDTWVTLSLPKNI